MKVVFLPLLQSITGSYVTQGEFKMAAELKESTEKPMFICSSCGFECHYEYFGKKPPFSKSVVYVLCFHIIVLCFFLFFNKISSFQLHRTVKLAVHDLFKN